MKIRLLLPVLSAVLLAGQTPLTLEEAERLAIKGSPEVAASLLNAAAANQVTLEVSSASQPVVFGSVTGVGTLTNSRIAAGGLNNPSVFDRLAGGFTATQLITDFGRTGALTASARYRAEARGQAAQATRAQIILQVDRAFLGVLRAQSVLLSLIHI